MLKRLSGIIEQAWRGGASRSSSAPGRSPRQPFFSRLRAKYDAANTTLDNMNHWSRADGLSSAAANSPDVRRTLRNRSRYEVANNSYARGITLTLANDVVGTGPRLQMLTPDAEANRFVEQEFFAWAEAVGLAEKLRTMRLARVSDGESFGLLTSNERVNSTVKLDLRLIEADQVASPTLVADRARYIDGIQFDADGNPLSYDVLREHHGDVTFTIDEEFGTVPAAAVLHYFRCDRPGQIRGIPDITPALPRRLLKAMASSEQEARFSKINTIADLIAATASDPKLELVAQKLNPFADRLLPSDTARQLLGTDWVRSHVRAQLVAAGVNGLLFERIDTGGLVQSADELAELVGSETEMLEGGIFRRSGKVLRWHGYH